MTKLKIDAIVKSDRQKSWKCYTDPNHIVNWNFATEDWCCPNAENDLRVGGKYRARMEAKDGSFGFDFTAIYKKLEIGKSFSYEMEDGRSVEVNFNNVDGATEIVVEFDPENQNPLEMQRDGWQAILNNFKSYVENLS
jgi:uncharacterized protein YndB with AHSA1/START domain